MSDTKHTPGPWTAEEYESVGGLRQMIRGPNGGHLATLMPFYDDEEKANARLIAAAPDMLAALEAIHKAILEHKMEHSDFGVDIGTMVVEAIDQAKGTQQPEPA